MHAVTGCLGDAAIDANIEVRMVLPHCCISVLCICAGVLSTMQR